MNDVLNSNNFGAGKRPSMKKSGVRGGLREGGSNLANSPEFINVCGFFSLLNREQKEETHEQKEPLKIAQLAC